MQGSFLIHVPQGNLLPVWYSELQKRERKWPLSDWHWQTSAAYCRNDHHSMIALQAATTKVGSCPEAEAATADQPTNYKLYLRRNMLVDDNNHCYTAQELTALNVLKHPVYVFDIERKCMFWANVSALEVWNAPTLEALLERDFASDMSEAAESRLKNILANISRGDAHTEQWTLYPKGVATTLSLTLSAIRIDDHRIAALCEAELPDKHAFQEDTVRGLEILRHLPFAVSQYSMEGKLIYQNPEAVSLFGVTRQPITDAPSSSSLAASAGNASPQSDDGIKSGDGIKNNPPISDGDSGDVDFHRRFVDRNVAVTAFHQVTQEGRDFSAEAQHVTTQGPRWFSTAVRRTRDPVTSKYMILHSARDISEIIEARHETTRAAMKSEFMAIMAHEIRTPLHQMIGYLDLLALTQLSTEQMELFSEVQNSTSMLMSIVNDLLDYSKLECGQMQVENVSFGMDGVAQGCIAAVKPQADRKLLTVESYVEAGIPTKLVGDPNRLRQILLNLLSNAVKFTNEGSITLTISTVEEDKTTTVATDCRRLRFVVADTGIGIASTEQKSLFEKYNQANTSVARRFGGTGLGLAICKGLVGVMGGTIGIESEVGKGSSFFFEIPFQLPSLSVPVSSTTAMQSSNKDVKELNVLVVEDNKINQKVMSSMLQRLGHNVTLAENGQIALDEIRNSTFDIVLMDVQMPVMDGIECTKAIRGELGFGTGKLPIIGLTASFQTGDIDYYHDIGMTGCLGKPLRLGQLKAALATACTEEGEP